MDYEEYSEDDLLNKQMRAERMKMARGGENEMGDG